MGEGVHASRDLLSGLPQEEIGRLEHRRVDRLVAVKLEQAEEPILDGPLDGSRRRNDVVRPADSPYFGAI
jgi:hypothetical protein